MQLRAVSFNIHRALDRRGTHRPQPIVELLRELRPDLVALQEVDTRLQLPDGRDQLSFLGHSLGLHVVAGPNIRHGEGQFYGNAVLTRLPPRKVRRVDLSVPGREPRGLVDLELPGGLRVLATHLGLRREERRRQIGALVAQLNHGAAAVTVVLGDFNEWGPFNRNLRLLQRHLGATPRRRTFPARWPVLALDRVWVLPRPCLRSVRVAPVSPQLRVSDHRPLVATIACDEAADR